MHPNKYRAVSAVAGVIFVMQTACLPALALAPARPVPELEDGFYRLLDKGGTSFPANDGQTVNLGDNLGKQFGTATIRAANNDNTEFGLTLRGAAKLWDGPDSLPLALVVNNVCMRCSGNSVPHDGGTRDLWFRISGIEAARRVAKALKCEVTLRRHPGHQLVVKWTPDKESYQAGETIKLKFELNNLGTSVVAFRAGGQQRGPRDNQYRFIAQQGYGMGKGVPDTGDPTNFGGISSTRTLKPGETYTAEVELNKWFKLEQADIYRITGIWELHLEDPNAGNFDRGIWDDLVTGQCMVTVTRPRD